MHPELQENAVQQGWTNSQSVIEGHCGGGGSTGIEHYPQLCCGASFLVHPMHEVSGVGSSAPVELLAGHG